MLSSCPTSSRELEKVVASAERGFLLLAKDDGRTELYVLPDYRSQGIGAALVSAVLERARETGIVAMDLEIDVSHHRAQSLYRRFGFRPLDRARWVKELPQ